MRNSAESPADPGPPRRESPVQSVDRAVTILELLARRGEEVFAIGAVCTHYSGPLAEGLLVGDTVRCPWHHACFSLRTGEAIRAPALKPVSCWRVERREGKIYVHEKQANPSPRPFSSPNLPRSVVIIGGGAAGNAAAETLRKEGYAGSITMLSADDSGPYDRPNLSKGFLAGSAEEDWIPLRSPDFYKEHGIDLRLATPRTASCGSLMQANSLLTRFSSPPVPTRCGSTSKAAIFRMCIICARLPTAALLSPSFRPCGGPW